MKYIHVHVFQPSTIDFDRITLYGKIMTLKLFRLMILLKNSHEENQPSTICISSNKRLDKLSKIILSMVIQCLYRLWGLKELAHH